MSGAVAARTSSNSAPVNPVPTTVTEARASTLATASSQSGCPSTITALRPARWALSAWVVAADATPLPPHCSPSSMWINRPFLGFCPALVLNSAAARSRHDGTADRRPARPARIGRDARSPERVRPRSPEPPLAPLAPLDRASTSALSTSITRYEQATKRASATTSRSPRMAATNDSRSHASAPTSRKWTRSSVPASGSPVLAVGDSPLSGRS